MSEHALAMKRDWDQRAAEDARWYINTVRPHQTEEEFDATGFHEVQRQVVDVLPLLTGNRDPQQLRCLEIGCGIGRMTKHLAALFSEVAAVDVSGEMIRQAQARLSGLPNVRLFETNGQDFSLFPDASFDVIFSAYVFQHIPSAAIIRGNIVDAFRVLRPGGVFKFVTNGITDESFRLRQKDSWHGDVFPETNIRMLARELGAQLLGLFGEETQYCWTMLRRRQAPKPPPANFREGPPQILLSGQADDLSDKEISLRSPRPYLTLILRGAFCEWDDANTLIVEVGDRRLLPRYAGPPNTNFVGLLPEKFVTSFDNLLQVNVRLDAALPVGEVPVRARLFDGLASTDEVIKLI